MRAVEGGRVLRSAKHTKPGISPRWPMPPRKGANACGTRSKAGLSFIKQGAGAALTAPPSGKK